MTNQIQLTQGKVALVSDHRYEFLMQCKWHAHKGRYTWYAAHFETKSQQLMLMHRVITNAPDGTEVDHWDRNGLNNVDENLRVCTPSQNQHNRKLSRNSTMGFKGVSFDTWNNRYRATIIVSMRKVSLGYFDDPIDAALAYDAKAIEIYGPFARTNF